MEHISPFDGFESVVWVKCAPCKTTSESQPKDSPKCMGLKVYVFDCSSDVVLHGAHFTLRWGKYYQTTSESQPNTYTFKPIHLGLSFDCNSDVVWVKCAPCKTTSELQS